MRRIITYISALSILCLFAGCSDATVKLPEDKKNNPQINPVEEYINLKKGNTWEYEVYNTDGSLYDTLVYTISDVITLPDSRKAFRYDYWYKHHTTADVYIWHYQSVFGDTIKQFSDIYLSDAFNLFLVPFDKNNEWYGGRFPGQELNNYDTAKVLSSYNFTFENKNYTAYIISRPIHMTDTYVVQEFLHVVPNLGIVGINSSPDGGITYVEKWKLVKFYNN